MANARGRTINREKKVDEDREARIKKMQDDLKKKGHIVWPEPPILKEGEKEDWEKDFLVPEPGEVEASEEAVREVEED